MYEMHKKMNSLLGEALISFGIGTHGTTIWHLQHGVVIEGPHENDEGCECFALEVEGSPRGRFDMQTAAKKAMMYSHLESKKMNKRPNLIRHMKELLGNSLLDYGNTTEDGNFTYFLRNAASIEGPREDEDGWECFDVWYAGLHRGTYNTAEVAVRVALSY